MQIFNLESLGNLREKKKSCKSFKMFFLFIFFKSMYNLVVNEEIILFYFLDLYKWDYLF